VLPPSAVGFGKEQGPERGEDSVVSHYSQTMAATTTLPLVVQRTIKAPPGKLGVTLAVTSEGPRVRSVKVGSPVEDLLFAGDVLIGINDTNTQPLSTPAIYKLLEQTNDMPRSITVLTIDDVTRKQPKSVVHNRRQREQQRR
jgi:C-terminal processing protease CtpA/Prc